jgi:hypothetical protein
MGYVRGTSRWQHARNEKRIINRDEGGDGRTTSSGTHYVLCAWLDCTNDGLELYKVISHTHADGYEERNMHYAFCCEKHKQYWLDDIARNRR